MTTSRPGMALLEMLFCVTIVTLAMGVGLRLLSMVVRSYNEIPVASHAILSQEQWLAALRADAWRATQRDVSDPAKLTLTIDDHPVLWRQEAGKLMRTSDDTEQQWQLPKPLQWSTVESVLVLSDSDARVPLAMPSLAEGSR